MYIANPIYDATFKFMMEDEDTAKAFISAIINEQIRELKPAPPVEKANKTYAICQLDFLAKLDTAAGGKTVKVEVLKTQFSTNIMWFRRYPDILPDMRYPDENNGSEESGKVEARQIYCIYILLGNLFGYKSGVKDIPVIEVSRKTTNGTTNGTTNESQLDECNDFIDGCHCRSWIVQIPELKKPRRNELETMLCIFDRNYRVFFSDQVMNVPLMSLSEKFSPISERLMQALETQEVINQMNAEEFYIESIRYSESILAEKELLVAKNNREIAERKKELMKKNKKEIEEASREFAEIKQLLLNMRNGSAGK
ncbi:MAG: hypothetical protein LBD35_02510 [Prevotellaceae bacterium]|jgi:hypothetical protein|nr:hypothetical protein [Prevotellaceae bacterium]